MAKTLSNARRLSMNALMGMLLALCRLPLTFIMTPIFIAYLGDDGFGTWALVNGIVMFTSFGYMGMPASITKHVAQYQAEDDPRKMNELINSANLVHLVMAGLVLVVFLGLWPVLSRVWFADVDRSVHRVFLTYVLLLTSVVMGLLGNSYSSLLQGYQRADLHTGISILSRIIAAVVGWLMLKWGYGMAGLASAGIVGEAFRLAGMALMSYRVCSVLKFRPRMVSRDMIREVTSFGVKMLMGGGALAVFVQIDKMMIDKFEGVDGKVWVGLYALAAQLLMQLKNYPFLMQRPVLAAASEIVATGDTGRLNRLFARAQKYGVLFSVILFSGVFVLGGTFMQLWVGHEYTAAQMDAVEVALMVLAVGQLAAAGGHASYWMAIGLHRPGMVTVSSVGTAVLNLVLSFVLGWYWGFMGVVVASAVAFAAGAVYLCVGLSRGTKLGVTRALVRAAAVPVLSAVVSGGVTRWFLIRLPEPTWWDFLAGGGLFTGLLLALLLVTRHLTMAEFVGILKMKPRVSGDDG